MRKLAAFVSLSLVLCASCVSWTESQKEQDEEVSEYLKHKKIYTQYYQGLDDAIDKIAGICRIGDDKKYIRFINLTKYDSVPTKSYKGIYCVIKGKMSLADAIEILSMISGVKYKVDDNVVIFYTEGQKYSFLDEPASEYGDSYVIYSELIKYYLNEYKIPNIYVLDSSRTIDKHDILYIKQMSSMAATDTLANIKLSDEPKKIPVQLEKFGVALVNSEEFRSIMKKNDGWDLFYKKYPDAAKQHGIFTFSDIAFNKEKTQAIVLVGNWSGPLSGGIYVYVLEKYKNHWFIIERHLMAVS